MKQLPIIACVLYASIAFAQGAPRLQVFGGFSFLTFSCAAIQCYGTNQGALAGWNSEATAFVNHLVGLTADVGGYYRTFTLSPPPQSFQARVSQYTFLFGPTLRIPPTRKRAFAFAHVLFGANRSSDKPQPFNINRTDTGWAMALGGCIGVNASKMLGLQYGLDWVRTNNYSQGRNEFRFAAGIVLNLPPIGKS